MNKKILVTGAFGFIGSHLVEYLLNKNYDVLAYDRYNIHNNWGWLENSEYKNEIEAIQGDIRDYDSVSKAISKVDVVINLAALIGIPYSYISPLAYLKTNLEGTYNICEASKNYSIEQVIITSTSEVYGTALHTPINEEHPLQAQSPYSASKIAADSLAISYHRSFNLPVKIARPFNNYGPRQSARAIIPTIITQILNNNNGVIEIGNTKPTRDFIYVEDTCKAFELIIKNENLYGEIINIGTQKDISIADLVKLISNLMKIEISIKTSNERVRPAKSEVDKLVASNRKLQNYLNWVPDKDFKKGLVETIDWFKLNIENYKSNFYNV